MARSAADAKQVIFKGKHLLEFQYNAPAKTVGRIPTQVCGSAGFETDASLDYHLSQQRLLVTCRATPGR